MIYQAKDTIKSSVSSSNYPIAFTGQRLSHLSGVPTYEELILGYPIHEILSLEFFFKSKKRI
ncbi:hypothetical protein [Bacillus toyonensis]|uniref:hypothetical protein n=1 Tax=Bacillus toyonensis TaxID=155322 RepID=UPI0009B1D973|nr:hypothetical protein [Bacillus toyonensis]OQD35995.1 hypothetical protein B1K97_00453 [Bacillus toyonensis]